MEVLNQIDPDADEFDTMPPKTRDSKRDVSLTKWDIALLREIQQEQREVKFSLSRAYKDHNLIFAKKDGLPYRPNYVTKYFRELTKGLGLKGVKFHHLRHTFATKQIKSGIDIKTVSETLGHFDTSFTCKTYIHLFRNDKKEAAKKYEKYLEAEERAANNKNLCDKIRDMKKQTKKGLKLKAL